MQRHLDTHVDDSMQFQRPNTSLSVTTEALLDMSMDTIPIQGPGVTAGTPLNEATFVMHCRETGEGPGTSV